MSVLVDSSVWIDFFNGRETPETAPLTRAVQQGVIVIGDLIMLEVFQGCRSDLDFHRLQLRFSSFRQVSLFSTERAVGVAENYRQLRVRGVTVRKTIDVIIGSYCIREKLPLLYSDRDFDPMVKHLGLIKYRG